MKILQIASSTSGGAGIAASRLNASLNSLGVESILFSGDSVNAMSSENEIVFKKTLITRSLSKLITVLQATFLQRHAFLMTPYSLETSALRTIMKHKPDVIHLHTFYNLLSVNSISQICNSGIPIFITLHDERFYTGGCHHSLACQKFRESCLACPETSRLFQNVTAQAQKELILALGSTKRLTVIAPSEWIAHRARSSKALMNADVIQVHNPVGREFIEGAKRHRKPKDSSSPYLVTFVAQDLYSPYKGLDTLLECIQRYNEEFIKENIKFIFVGKGPEIFAGSLKARQVDQITPSELVDIYLESDLLVVPSLADNSPNVIFEALICGTPFVGSDRAGIPEISNLFGMESFKYGDPESMFWAILKQKQAKLDSKIIKDIASSMVQPEIIAQKISQLYLSKSTTAS
jgi:glycosyltransferase involved in cell wall biosynthesis